MSKKHKFLRTLWYFAPPIIWMIFIFFLSSKTKVSATQVYIYDFIIFKSLHLVEYATLFFLNFRAMHSLRLKPIVYEYLFSIGISIVYAATDEIHQLFISTRQGSIRDILIDTLGMLIMYMLVKRYYRFLKRLL